MNLGELALTCFAYGAMSYDDSLVQFERRVEGNADLSREEHRLALLHWLNQWQCRQFSPASHDLASDQLLEWHEAFTPTLPPKRAHLWELAEATVEEYAPVFDSLSEKAACTRERGGQKVAVSFGPTAAAKILFVLRPRVFVAWDEPIRAGFKKDGSGRSYVDFLIRLREELLDLQEQCRAFHLELQDLPEALGRPLSTPAQLLGEFYWASVIRGVMAPSRQQVARWLEWYTPPQGSPAAGRPTTGRAAALAAQPVAPPAGDRVAASAARPPAPEEAPTLAGLGTPSSADEAPTVVAPKAPSTPDEAPTIALRRVRRQAPAE